MNYTHFQAPNKEAMRKIYPVQKQFLLNQTFFGAALTKCST